ncbi:hypothetical protein [Clostridium sp. Cult2]|uniref:hypothetical protein n=1 Tax=Clostridium sp. Cult2 TaxID=2079003 RepID=UPI001F171ABD|nr:hypothetical protein [Clostridium sp. Cult2]MCF6466377.1 hypothetical protein [Clostridium sp. Cult2]
MKHYIKAGSKYKSIKNEEVINLINERDRIELGTQVVAITNTSEVLIEVIEIEGDKVWWEIKKIRGMSNG